MKQNFIIAITVALVFVIQLVTAGSVTDTYTAGDTLTTTTLDNIKTAVNDNNAASRFYGDGSAGALTISAPETWVTTPPAGNNLNFTNVVIDAGGELTVPAGTTIRCSGTFTNNGTITVTNATNSGSYHLSSAPAVNGGLVVGRGDARKAAGSPDGHTALGVILSAGLGGAGIPQTVAASSFNNFKIGGGSSGRSVFNGGFSGGGLVKISCQGGIINNGIIEANSFFGGGGGIVILASSTAIDNDSGTINANGGQGADALNNTIFLFYSRGAAGGGGGGIIVLVAPTITNLGTTSVAGGSAGTGATLTQALHSAGSGGGASGGNGGTGGGVTAANVASASTAGGDGYVLEITANPAHMM